MLRQHLASLVVSAVDSLIASGRLPEAVREAAVEIIDTKQPEHGDFACNFAMAAAKKAGMQPRQIGEMLQEELMRHEPFQAIQLAGPGFINLRLKPEFVGAYVANILQSGDSFARIQAKNPLRLNVEFVSVNPNGPITVGSGRGAAFGDTLCRVLEAAGHTVNREYYINDGVNSEQMRRFALSIKAHVLQLLDSVELPEDTQYRGEYVKRVAKNLLAEQSMLRLGTNYELWEYAFTEICQAAGRTDLFALGPAIYGDAENCRHRLELLLRSDTPINNLAGTAGDILDLTAAVFVAAHGFMPVSWPAAQFEQRYRELVLSTLLIAEALRAGESVNVVDTIRMMDDFTNVARQLFAKSLEIYGTSPDRVSDEVDEEVAEIVATQIGDEARKLPTSWYQQIGQQIMLHDQAQSLEMFGVRFDTWFSEQALHEAGVVESLLDELVAKGVADDQSYRLKMVITKKGIESIEREEQAADEEDGDDQAVTPGPSPSEARGETLWLRSTKFGDDMDRVLRRRDGRLTYISSDVAYHADKFNRPLNADKLITILGPDHHGYIARLHAVVAAFLENPEALSLEPTEPLSEVDAQIYRSAEERDACQQALEQSKEKLEVVIFQIVRFLKEGKPAPMRKRDGNIYELRDLIQELGQAAAPNESVSEQLRIGRDVARFFYLMRSHDTHMDFDIDLATKQSDENPVFYAQYAHARIASILRKAEETLTPGPSPSEGRGELLTHPRETGLIKKILDLPFEVERCASDYGVHRLTTYAVELARTFHHFYDACRVIQPDQPDLTAARLDLCKATKIALKATFDLVGVSAPEKMER